MNHCKTHTRFHVGCPECRTARMYAAQTTTAVPVDDSNATVQDLVTTTVVEDILSGEQTSSVDAETGTVTPDMPCDPPAEPDNTDFDTSGF